MLRGVQQVTSKIHEHMHSCQTASLCRSVCGTLDV